MQAVSRAYAESMKQIFRNRGYIMVTFGLINQEAQANATVENTDLAYFSVKNTLFENNEDEAQRFVYATLEPDWTKVDGSMYFPPRPESGAYLDTKVTSNAFVEDDAPFVLNMNLNIKPVEIKGLSIDFGENYPIDFDVIGDSGVLEFRGNDSGIFKTEQVIGSTSTLSLKIYKLLMPHTRFRIYSFVFGYGLVYRNNDVITSELNTYVSPIGEEVPQIDFSLTLKNYDKYFNVDNPKSALNFFETGQEMQISYGYELPSGEIEWLLGNTLKCSEWEADDRQAVIRCVDTLRECEDEYYKGFLANSPRTYYDLAEELLITAGIENYYLDPHLKTLSTKNPLPKVSYREGLQIIANACRCMLTQDREGAVVIKSNFIPERTASANDKASYSKLENVTKDIPKVEYANLTNNYTVADGGMFLLDKEHIGGLETGYVSESVSDDTGHFEVNPVLTITQEAGARWNGARIVFGETWCSEFIVRTYFDNVLNGEWEITDGAKEYTISEKFPEFEVMEIEFVKTKEPIQRVVVNYFEFTDVADIRLERHDMLSSPKAIKQELVKDLIVPFYTYNNSKQGEQSLLSQDIVVKSGDEIDFTLGEASYNYRALLGDSSSGVSVVSSGAYYVRLRFTVTGSYKLQIMGYRYDVSRNEVVVNLNNRGQVIMWDNPLVSDRQMALDLAEWLGDYYNAGVEYEYDTRGNPELDTNDLIRQENDFIENMLVRVFKQSLTFNGAFRGNICAVRVKEKENVA